MSSTTSTAMMERKDDDESRTRRFEETDALDTAQIIAELRGEVAEEYFYEIKDPETGKVQPGLSFSGTKWIASQMAVGENPHPLTVEHLEITESPDGETFRAIAIVKDLATGEKRPGVYEQSKFRRRNVWDEGHKKKIGEEEVMVDMYNREGKKIGQQRQRDPHAYTIAGSKASRNGMRHHMPEPVILGLYEKWKADKALGFKKDTPAADPLVKVSKNAQEAKVTETAPKTATAALPPEEISLDQLKYDFRDLDSFIAKIEATDEGFKVWSKAGVDRAGIVAINDIMTTYRGSKKGFEGSNLVWVVPK